MDGRAYVPQLKYSLSQKGSCEHSGSYTFKKKVNIPKARYSESHRKNILNPPHPPPPSISLSLHIQKIHFLYQMLLYIKTHLYIQNIYKAQNTFHTSYIYLSITPLQCNNYMHCGTFQLRVQKYLQLYRSKKAIRTIQPFGKMCGFAIINHAVFEINKFETDLNGHIRVPIVKQQCMVLCALLALMGKRQSRRKSKQKGQSCPPDRESRIGERNSQPARVHQTSTKLQRPSTLLIFRIF